MLTVDLVRAHRRGPDLVLSAMKPGDRERARELADRYLAIVAAHVGQTRGELDDALATVQVGARDRKLAGGLRKLLLDRCRFEAAGEHDPAAVRRALFERACQGRRAGRVGDDFDRERILGEVADELGLDAADQAARAARVERLMYSDLERSHRLLAMDRISADALVEHYEEGQAQAVLLRARWVRARVLHARPGEYRALFRKLKFLRLLHTISALEGGGYEIAIDGPYSMFRSVTKYGLQLALVLPALRACERWSLEAEVEWGKQRQPLRFRLQADSAHGPLARDAGAEPRLPDEVADLVRRWTEREEHGKTEWRVSVAGDILSLPGVGLCVPDLVFTHARTGERVYLEVMGFWSRDAVWQRVELVEGGLSEHVIFAVSSRLRVSEAALDPELPGALYVYKGAMSPSAVEERLRRLAGSSEE